LYVRKGQQLGNKYHINEKDNNRSNIIHKDDDIDKLENLQELTDKDFQDISNIINKYITNHTNIKNKSSTEI